MPEAADFFTGPGQPLAGAAATELAVAQVGHAEVFQIPLEEGRISLDGVRGDPEVARPLVGSRAEVDRALEGNAEEDDAGRRVRSPARDEAWVCRFHGENLMQAGEKGPDARRRPKAACEAYSLYVERAAEGANEGDGPLSPAC